MFNFSKFIRNLWFSPRTKEALKRATSACSHTVDLGASRELEIHRSRGGGKSQNFHIKPYSDYGTRGQRMSREGGGGGVGAKEVPTFKWRLTVITERGVSIRASTSHRPDHFHANAVLLLVNGLVEEWCQLNVGLFKQLLLDKNKGEVCERWTKKKKYTGLGVGGVSEEVRRRLGKRNYEWLTKGKCVCVFCES